MVRPGREPKESKKARKKLLLAPFSHRLWPVAYITACTTVLACTTVQDVDVDVDVVRVRSAGNVTVITRNIPRNLRVGKIENYA